MLGGRDRPGGGAPQVPEAQRLPGPDGAREPRDRLRPRLPGGRAVRPAWPAEDGGDGLEGRAAVPAGALAHGEKQWLEIGMVLASEPRVLLLDEPVAGLSDDETARTAELIGALRRPDRAILVIEHDMAFVEAVADRVTVLHEGRTLFEGAMAGARADARVIDVFSADDAIPHPHPIPPPPAGLTVSGLDQHYGSAQVLRSVGFQVAPAPAWR